MDTQDVTIAPYSPGQNPFAGRLVVTIRPGKLGSISSYAEPLLAPTQSVIEKFDVEQLRSHVAVLASFYRFRYATKYLASSVQR